MATNKQKLSVILDDDLYKAIEDHWYNNRMKSRSQAAADLIKKGVESLENEKKDK